MRIGKREQIVIYGILGLLAALLVHVFVFSKKSAAYREANNQMVVAEGSLRNLQKPQSPLQLRRYQEMTDEYRAKFRAILEEFSLKLPTAWGPEGTKETQWNEIAGLLARLRELRARGEAENRTKLVFLGEGQYFWNFPTALPTVVQQGQRNLYDVLSTLLGNLKSVRASAGSTQDFIKQQFEAYAMTMALLDINYFLDFASFARWTQRPIPSLFEIYQQCGPVVPYLKISEHVRLFLENQPADVRAELKTRDNLMELLGLNDQTGRRSVPAVPDVLTGRVAATPAAGTGNRPSGNVPISINLPWHAFVLYQLQLTSLIDIIERADKAGIQAIEFVRLRESREVIPVPKFDETTATPTPTPAAEEEIDWDFGEGDSDWGTNQNKKPAAADGTGSGIFATPIDMVVVGSNQAISQFLYDLSTARRPMEVDSVSITSTLNPQTGQATLRAKLSINVLAWIVGVDAAALQ